MIEIGTLQIPFPVVLLGAITGMTYGILAVGLLFIYRSSKIINFAHGEIGAFGAAMLGLAIIQWHFPYWVAFPLAIALGAAVGALSELAVIRRLRNAPSLMSIVATLGLAQFILYFSFAANSTATAGTQFPQPAGFPSVQVGALTMTPAYSATLILTPFVVAALAFFLIRTRYGLFIRASAANVDAARMAGISASQMSTIAWAIGGAVAAYTAILIFPTHGFVTAQTLGPTLLVRALAPAVLARMANMPIALVAGIILGVVEQVVLWNYTQAGIVEAALFAVILFALLVQRQGSVRGEDRTSWTAVAAWPPLPEAFAGVWAIRNLGRLGMLAAVLIAIALPVWITSASTVIVISMLAIGIVGLSVGIVTGLAGQISLGQFALAGVGAAASILTVRITGNFETGLAAAGLAAALMSLIIGLPALRVRGLFLAVTSLSFAVAAGAWLLPQSSLLASGVDPGHPAVLGVEMESSKHYYYLALGLLLLSFWLSRNVWTSSLGRLLRALRDNEDGARAFTVPATRVRLQGFMLSGFIAGIGGAVLAHLLTRVGPDAFPVDLSLKVVAMTAIGGVGLIAGPLIGTLYIIGLPHFLPLDNATLAGSALGWLILILYFPGGIAQLLRPVRERVADWLAIRAGIDPVIARAEAAPTSMSQLPATDSRVVALSDAALHSATPDVPVLSVRALTKSYGGVAAVQDVSFDVAMGEVLGIIGPNGAGKTTLFELISGFTRADTGTTTLNGQELTAWGPERRASLGLVRSFQDPRLFPTLTVLETVMVSLERITPSGFFESCVGGRGTDRVRAGRARELVSAMGLYPWRNTLIGQLSTGTRRITELACIMALEPAVILLDEPSSGIAQRESEALGEVLMALRQRLQATLLVIEHDIPLLMGVATRIIAMESGRVIADGRPEQVTVEPRVVEAYLGGDIRAVERSGRRRNPDMPVAAVRA